ncbi:hypothetical protein Tco_0429369 [Tanacetum coccineum]
MVGYLMEFNIFKGMGCLDGIHSRKLGQTGGVEVHSHDARLCSFLRAQSGWSWKSLIIFAREDYVTGLVNVDFGEVFIALFLKLSCRMKMFLLNPEVQSAFVADRQILDGPFILNELGLISFQRRWVDAGLFNELIELHGESFSFVLCGCAYLLFGHGMSLIWIFVEFWNVFWASGLRIIMIKRKFMGVNVEDDEGETCIENMLGMKVLKKVLSRLSRWKLKTLSIGGRFTLLKSVLGSMPIFHMSIFKVPSSILNSLEVIRSRFFNGHEHKSNKATWFKWNKVLTSKEKVIKALYGEDGSLDKVGASAARTCWTTIVQEVKVIQAQGINIHDFIKLKLGNGEDSRFWLDKWYEGGVLKRRGIEQNSLILSGDMTENNLVGARLIRVHYGRWRMMLIFVASIRKDVRRQSLFQRGEICRQGGFKCAYQGVEVQLSKEEKIEFNNVFSKLIMFY